MEKLTKDSIILFVTASGNQLKGKIGLVSNAKTIDTPTLVNGMNIYIQIHLKNKTGFSKRTFLADRVSVLSSIHKC